MKNKKHSIPLLSVVMTFFTLLISIYSIAQVDEEWIVKNVNELGEAGIEMDNSGNLYVAGSGHGGYVIIRYNSKGEELWKRIFTAPSGGCQAHALATDKNNNVYVTGEYVQSFGGDEFGPVWATVKFNSDGVQQWVQYYDAFFQNGYDLAFGITADEQENVYVTGSSRIAGTPRLLTIKYNKAGEQQWAKTNLNINEGYKLKLDKDGNVYVLAANYWNPPLEYVLVKYAPGGAQVWEQHFKSSGGASLYSAPHPLGIDDSANLYIAGSTDQHFLVIKYNKDGVLQWSAEEPGGTAESISIDRQGNVIAAGPDTTRNLSGRLGWLTIKYDSSGIRKWVNHYQGQHSTSLTVGNATVDVTLDSIGNVYVTGGDKGSAGLANYATIKYNTNGVQQWIQHYEAPKHSWLVPAGISLDRFANVYITGTSATETECEFNYDRFFTTLKYSQTPPP